MLTHDLDGNKEAFPLVLFSAGKGVGRLMYTNIAVGMASRGYIVGVMGETGEEELESDENRRRMMQEKHKRIPFWKEDILTTDIAKVLETRVADVRFVLDELLRMKLFPKIKRGDGNGEKEIDNDDEGGLHGRKVGIIGHLLGGNTAAIVMRQDKRFSAGASMDGIKTDQNPNIDSGDAQLDSLRPFLIMESSWENHRVDSSVLDSDHPHRDSFGERAPRTRKIVVKGAEYLDWTDLPFLWQEMDVWDKVPAEMRLGHGSIEPRRMLEIQDACLGPFLDLVLKGVGQGLLEGEGEKFAEMEV